MVLLAPITLMFLAFRETGHVPDVGGTLMLLAVGLGVLFCCRFSSDRPNQSDVAQHQGIR
jgi:hypothetical protein